MRSTDVKITEYYTDSGPVCPHCDMMLWAYRLYSGCSVATGEDGSPHERCDTTSTFVARCASCHCSESWDSRGCGIPETVQLVRWEHDNRRQLARQNIPYALARTFIVRHSMPWPTGNLLVLAFSAKQAEAIALWQLIGGPALYVHADDPLDPTCYGTCTPTRPVPCHACGQDVPLEEVSPGWGFLQLHRSCKDVERRRGMADVTKRVQAGF